MNRLILLFLVLSSYSALCQSSNLSFREFDLEIDDCLLWDKEKVESLTYIYEAEVDIELGETLEGTTLRISNSVLTEISIEMRYETSITLMNEGPHCDLIDWKHHTSDWASLEEIDNNTFVTLSYSLEDWEKFPQITLAELAEASTKFCPGWEDVVNTVKSPLEYPASVGVSRYFLRITGIDEGGSKVSRLITFNVPMGC